MTIPIRAQHVNGHDTFDCLSSSHPQNHNPGGPALPNHSHNFNKGVLRLK